MAGEQLYQFQAGPEACDLCSGMDGQVSEGGGDLPHEGCACQVVPLSAGEDCPSYEWSDVGTERYGPRGGSARVYFEIEVTCCDGSTIGETLEIDLGVEPGGRTMDDEFEEVEAAMDEAAEELASGCGPDEFLCC
jgi:hypothetical protein